MSVLDRFRLDGRRAVVTGASRGLGRVMALALAEAGADVVITGRTPETLDATAGEIRARGRQAWTMTVDMGVPADCQAAWQRILADMGPIDILINNVGNREVSVPIASESLETWQKSIDLNLTSCFLGTRLAARPCWRAGRAAASSTSRRSAR